MFAVQQHKMSSTRPIDVASSSKRPLSPVPSTSSTKKVKVEHSCKNLRSFENDDEFDYRQLDGWGCEKWNNEGASNPINRRNFSQTFRHVSGDEYVKCDPAYLEGQCQDHQVQKAMENNSHTMERSTHPLRLESPFPSLASPCYSAESPTRHASSSSRRERPPIPPPRSKRRERPTPPTAPQMETLTSPSGATPPPLFFSSPRSDQLVDVEKAKQQDLRNTLGLGDNELSCIDNIVPSPSDDVFNTVPLQEHSLSKLVKKHHDGDHVSRHVKNPAKGPISKWTVVAKREREVLVGYPCDDFKFRTEKHDVLGTWDEMGNIKDIHGNIVH